MEAFVITINGLRLSEDGAKNCIRSGRTFGVDVKVFPATDRYQAMEEMNRHGLHINQSIYRAVSDDPVGDRGNIPMGSWWLTTPELGCVLSHFRLWLQCIRSKSPIIILEHDAVWIEALPKLPFRVLAMNLQHEPTFPSTGAYVITPRAARLAVKQSRKRGLQPADELLWRAALKGRHVAPATPAAVRVDDGGISTIQYSKRDSVHKHLADIDPWQDFESLN